MQKELRRKILKKWIEGIGNLRLLWEKCNSCGKVHGYNDVTEMDLDKLMNITIKEHESRRSK